MVKVALLGYRTTAQTRTVIRFSGPLALYWAACSCHPNLCLARNSCKQFFLGKFCGAPLSELFLSCCTYAYCSPDLRLTASFLVLSHDQNLSSGVWNWTEIGYVKDGREDYQKVKCFSQNYFQTRSLLNINMTEDKWKPLEIMIDLTTCIWFEMRNWVVLILKHAFLYSFWVIFHIFFSGNIAIFISFVIFITPFSTFCIVLTLSFCK